MGLVYVWKTLQEKNRMSIRTTVRFPKVLSLALVAFLLTMTAGSGRAQSRPQDNAPGSEQVRAKVTKLGTGKRARADITLKDDRRLKGYIGEISENSFTLVDPKRGTVTNITYDEVRKIKSRNNNVREVAVFGAMMGGIFILVLATVSSTR
jgi:hypothetical protein